MKMKSDVDLLDEYMQVRRIPIPSTAQEVLNLERFLIPRPEFIEGIEYHTFFSPTDGNFCSLFVGDSVMNYPMGATARVAMIAAEEYGLDPREQITRNSNEKFHELCGDLAFNGAGIIDAPGMEEFRRLFGDAKLEDVYGRDAVRAAVAEVEKKLPDWFLRSRGGRKHNIRFAHQVNRGFDLAHFYNPGPEGGIDEKVSAVFGLVQLLKPNGILVMQYLWSRYGISDAVKERLAQRGIKPVFEGSPVALSGGSYLDSIDIYQRPKQ